MSENGHQICKMLSSDDHQKEAILALLNKQDWNGAFVLAHGISDFEKKGAGGGFSIMLSFLEKTWE